MSLPLLRFKDGGDWYNTAGYGSQMWDEFVNVSFGTARFTGQSFQLSSGTNYVRKIIDSQQTWIVVLAYQQQASFGAGRLIEFIDSSTSQVDLRTDASGHLIVTRNGTVLGTSTITLISGVWYSIQFRVKIHGSTGTYDVVLDGSNILTGTGANTQSSGNATADSIKVQNSTSAGTIFVDDIHFFDGTTGTDFPGDLKITTKYATGNGTTNNFTAHGAGSNYQCVNEHPPDNDTTYVDDNTPGDIDLYTFGTITSVGTIFDITHNYVHRKDDAGTRQIAGVARSGGTNYVGATKTCSSSYVVAKESYAVNPNTSVAWASGVSPEFGVKVIT